MSLQDLIYNSKRDIVLYGTTPPRADAPVERLNSAAARLAERLSGAAVDGLVDGPHRGAPPLPLPDHL
jgi:hypothetical protein